jgi:hypothetical protein
VIAAYLGGGPAPPGDARLGLVARARELREQVPPTPASAADARQSIVGHRHHCGRPAAVDEDLEHEDR